MNNITFTEEEIRELVYQAVAKAEILIKNQRWEEAEAILKQAIRVYPNCEKALRMVSQLLITRNKSEEAIEFYEKLIDLKPNDYESLNNQALCYSAAGDIDKSIKNLKTCVDLYPEKPACYWNLAIQYKEKNDHKSSYDIYKKGIERLPEDADIRYNYAINLAEQQDFEEAIKQYKEAIRLRPDFAAAHFNLSLLNLLLGNYKEGWEGYEWRFEHAQVFKRFKERFAGTEWNGEDGEGKTILVYNEQGAGDLIQFARYIYKLKDRGFHVTLEAPYELIDLMAQCKGVDQVFPVRSKKLGKYDYYVSIGSLPLKLKMYEPFWDGPYLKPTGSGEQAFANYKECNRIGICWAGNPVHRHDKERSCFLKDFKHLNTVRNSKLFSLQKDARTRFWAGQGIVDLTEGCTDMGVVDMSDLLIDFNYTAAILQCMNHIVTVDTAVAHLAGAMGLPCHMLLQYMPDFRWGLKGETTNWYPSMKLHRQVTPGDYNSRLRHVAYEIRNQTD